MLYLLDANVLITANNHYYPLDSVPEFWEWLLYMAEEGRVKIPLEIFEEIKDGPTDNAKDLLFGWLQDDAVKTALLLDESVDGALVQEVITQGYAPDLSDTELELLGRDPFLVAYALAAPEARVVVTSEVSKPKRQRQNRHLPDVCQSVGVQCCDPFALNRVLGFRTDWKTKKS